MVAKERGLPRNLGSRRPTIGCRLASDSPPQQLWFCSRQSAWNTNTMAAKKSPKFRANLKQRRYEAQPKNRLRLTNFCLRVRRGWFTTRATKDCSLPAAPASRCGGFVTRLVRPGSGVIQRPARHFVCLIPARKSSSFRCQANDLTNQYYENKIHRYNRSYRRVADLSVYSDTADAATTAGSASCARHARTSREGAQGADDISRCGDVASSRCCE